MSDQIPLTDEQLDLIAEKILTKVHTKQHDKHQFWIDPEIHYQDHIAMRAVVELVKSGQSIFWKAFVGLVVIGTVVLASIGLAGKVMGK